MKKGIKTGIIFIVVGIVLYNSIYFRKLSEMKKVGTEKFNADKYVDELWKNALTSTLGQTISFEELIHAIHSDKEAALEKHTQALAIGNYRYALVHLKAEAVDIQEDEILISTQADSVITMHMATEFIYGNAVRDATGLVDVKDFPNTSDLNAISESFNARIRKDVVVPFKQFIKKGDKIDLVGAVELNKEHLKWQGLEIIPVQLKKLN